MYNAGSKDPDKSLYLQSDTCITEQPVVLIFQMPY